MFISFLVTPFDKLIRPFPQTKNKKDAEKVVKNIIKISVKVGMLESSEKFSAEERQRLARIQRNLRTIAMTLIRWELLRGCEKRGQIIAYLP